MNTKNNNAMVTIHHPATHEVLQWYVNGKQTTRIGFLNELRERLTKSLNYRVVTSTTPKGRIRETIHIG